MAANNCRPAVRQTPWPEKEPTAAPSITAANAPIITEVRTATIPLAKNHGDNGKIAPTEKETNDTTAACLEEPASSGSIPNSSRAWVSSASSGLAMRIRATVSASSVGTPRARYMAASSLCSPTGSFDSSPRSTSISCCTSSSWAFTDTSSPAAIEKAPASNPATPATRMALAFVLAPATPRMSEILVRSPSPAPRTAARAALPRTSR